ncbi:MAG TPA: alpha/beta hydrolase-fold protein [Solirubrobacteraceae bacterium]|jgi:enterochelin esterase-like enzyme|nr:alpha/beta hydrolase-fold protein [Solirubrobacteraceae bacterium]
MSSRLLTADAQPWLDGHGDWSWPGRRSEAAELRPPAWVPAVPPQLEPVLAGSSGALAGGAHGRLERSRSLAWWILVGLLLAALALAVAVTAIGRSEAERLAGLSTTHKRAPGPLDAAALAAAVAPQLASLEPMTESRAGSVISHATFGSPSLHYQGSFYSYVPAACAAPPGRCPALYLLHGRDGHANAFLEMGIQSTLDRLIARHAIPPMIVIMLQDRPTLQDWKDLAGHHSATYVVEVQELTDRMFRTIPQRWARAIAGSSMGGFGAMNVALANPLRFSVVESWLGFFNPLDEELQSARPVIERLGLSAFLYGAAEDPVAVPSEDPEFAASLRADGAQARGVIYPGGHTLEKIREHLAAGIAFAGRSLLAAQRRAAHEAAAEARAGLGGGARSARS